MHSSERPIALFAALEVEAAPLTRALVRSNAAAPGIGLYEGRLEGRPAVLAVGGVGKVAAAMTAQLLCDLCRAAAIIGFGLAGAISDSAQRGHVIVASGSLQHDMDARPLTRRRGEIPSLGTIVFEADARMAAALTAAARSVVEHPALVQQGLVLTGDQIVTAKQVRDALADEFAGASCIDMETAAIAQVAHRNGVPWGALRVTSDSADESFDLDEVLGFGARTAGELFERIMRETVKRL